MQVTDISDRLPLTPCTPAPKEMKITKVQIIMEAKEKTGGGNRFGRIDKYMTLIEMTDSYIQNKHQREVNNLNNQINDLNNTIERLRDELREKDTVVCRQCQPSELERDR